MDDRRAAKRSKERSCDRCPRKLHYQSKGRRCAACVRVHGKGSAIPAEVAAVFEEEARIAPAIPPLPRVTDSCIVVTDLHIPWHDPAVVLDLCEVAALLKIKTLIVGGDLIHADTISKYLGVGKSVPVTKELEACGRVLAALETIFERIVIIPGNHDQRVERTLSALRETKQGRQAFEMVASLLGAQDMDDAEDVSLRYLRHFLGSAKVTWHPLPDLLLNDTWLIQHPGTVSRIAPQTERAMVRKFRKSIIQGHSHLWGVGFDESATDVAFNCGHAADDKKWRYQREKITTFPASVKGYAVIYRTPRDPGGRLIPVALHDRMFRIQDLVEMIA